MNKDIEYGLTLDVGEKPGVSIADEGELFVHRLLG